MVTCPRCERSDRCLKYDHFNFSQHDPRVFVSFQFGSPWIVVIWNGIWLVYLLGTLIYDVISSRDKAWLAYHSNWTFVILLSSVVTEVIVRTCVIVQKTNILDGASDHVPWYIIVQWCLYNTSSVTTLLQTVMTAFWPEDVTFPFINKHFVTSVYVIINISIITSLPTKVFHMYQPLILACIYVIFAAIYLASTDHRSHLVFEYESKTSPSNSSLNVTVACMILIVIPILHVFIFCIYKLRLRIFSKQFKPKKVLAAKMNRPLERPVQRDTTTADIVLQKRRKEFHYVEVRPEIKDDLFLKLTADQGRESMLSGFDSRMSRSETDLRQYVSRNGFYCDFAPPSQISHYREDTSLFDERSSVDTDTKFGNESMFGDRSPCSEDRRGSHLILVKKCKSVDDAEVGVINEGMSDSISTVSSDYLSQYMAENRLAYM